LPNAPQELERISYLSKIYKESLEKQGVNVVTVTEKLKADIQHQSPTYKINIIGLSIQIKRFTLESLFVVLFLRILELSRYIQTQNSAAQNQNILGNNHKGLVHSSYKQYVY
jgi:hypothetical protein